MFDILLEIAYVPTTTNNRYQATKDLVEAGSLDIETLRSHVRKIIRVKWKLGLFHNPYLSEATDPFRFIEEHKEIALEAARKSIVLLKNANSTLPLKPAAQQIEKIALIGPFADTLNYGDYSGTWGEYPAEKGSTIRQSLLKYLAPQTGVDLVTSWGANSFEFNAQHVIPAYLLSANGTKGGLLATYFGDTDFKEPMVQKIEVPALDWGIYPPPGLPSNNFSAIWEGTLESPVDVEVDGWIGVAVGPNTTAKLFVDGELTAAQYSSRHSSIMANIMPYTYIQANSTRAPSVGVPFTFRKGARHHIRIEYQAYNMYKRVENLSSLNSQVLLFWNLVSRNGDAIDQAVQLAQTADVVVLAVGASWNSDGESGDRATLGLAPSQDALARSIFALGKPVVTILEGGRPFAIPEWYDASAAVLSAFFPGQAGGQAIADVLFGKFNPGGRLPLSVPRHVGQIPVYYNYKPSAHLAKYVDTESMPYYPFGYGLSFTTFSVTRFGTSVSSSSESTQTQNDPVQFACGDIVTFSANVVNTGESAGSYVAQVYLLGRVSEVVQPVKQLVAFSRVYLEPGEEVIVKMELEVDRYLQILNRQYEWELEKGMYTFALLDHGVSLADTSRNVTLQVV